MWLVIGPAHRSPRSQTCSPVPLNSFHRISSLTHNHQDYQHPSPTTVKGQLTILALPHRQISAALVDLSHSLTSWLEKGKKKQSKARYTYAHLSSSLSPSASSDPASFRRIVAPGGTALMKCDAPHAVLRMRPLQTIHICIIPSCAPTPKPACSSYASSIEL